MDLPVTLNVSLGNTAGSGADLVPQEKADSSSGSFSEHLEGKVKQLEGGQPDESTVSNTKEEAVAAVGSQEAEEELVAEGVVKDSLKMNELEEGVDALPVSGKELPNVEDVEASFNMMAAQIVFDPLSKPQKTPVQVTPQIDKPLLAEKLKFSSKNAADAFVATNSEQLSTDKVAFDNATKAAMSSNLTGELTQKLNGKPVVASAELLPNSAGQGMLAPNAQLPLQQTVADRPTLQLETPMGTSRWGQDFGQRVQWVVNQSMSGAQIRLNPHNMGPVEVRVQMQNDQVTLSFTAQHGATREAIEAALPRLREMFSEQNIDMADVDISQHSFSEQRERQATGEGNDEFSLLSEKDVEEDLFDGAENDQRMHYTGLFSGVA